MKDEKNRMIGLVVRPVVSPKELRQFISFPWRIYRDDPKWVPPLISDIQAKLDIKCNPFWQMAERELWIAWQGNQPVGRIAAIIDRARNQTFTQTVGLFGFFDAVDDHLVAAQLLKTAEDWLVSRGMTLMRGPYNPSPNDDVGIMVEGFDTRPAIMEGHNPSYYPAFFENNGFVKYLDTLARLVKRDPTHQYLTQALPEKLTKVAERVKQRKDLVLRRMNMAAWEDEIRLACRIYNTALAPLPDYVPVTEDEFLNLAGSFKPIMDAGMALIAEVNGKPVGYALALPDINEALRHVNGRLDPLGLLKLWWYSRKMKRASFKILMVLPDYQNRGIEALLVMQVAQAIWDQGYSEVDMSMTGEENEKSTRFQENLGFKVYRRYRIYEKPLVSKSV
jgi:GNAT superfamily N-acetyltransferase